jgi:hypothetical protein
MKRALLISLALTIASTASAQWTTTGTNMYNANTGGVGIGTSSILLKFQVKTGTDMNLGIGPGQADAAATQINAYNNAGTLNVPLEFKALKYNFSAGNVGIGTSVPNVLLDVYNAANSSSTLLRISGSAEAPGNYSGLLLGAGGLKGRGKGAVLYEPYGTNYGKGRLHFAVNSSYNDDDAGLADSKMTIADNGNVGIGTVDAQGYKLAVNGSIHSRSVKVDQIGWSDFVFEKSYKLPRLSEVKKYIDRTHHLPNIPSASEVQANGLDLGEMNNLLLRKVEELTLYLIEEHRKNLKLEARIKTLEENFSAVR